MSFSFSKNEFANSKVIIIGGDIGVGPAIVEAFEACGAKVVMGTLGKSASTDGAECSVSSKYAGIQVAINDSESVRRFFVCAERDLGSIDILVVVAPPVSTGSALDIQESEYRKILDKELMGPILCIQEAASRMTKQGAGRIISFVSMSGKTGVHRHVAPYAAAKGGLIAYSRVLAAELAPLGVTVNVVATALMKVQAAAIHDSEEVMKGIPVGRFGRSEEAAKAALYLASRDSGYVTGETLNLSGGRFMD